MNNLEVQGLDQEYGLDQDQEQIKIIKTPEEIIIYFLNCCDIKCDSINDINGTIIPRETLLDYEIYEKMKKDIPKLKNILSSTSFTAVQQNADTTQKWPLINLIRQILRKYNYQLAPKRICDGYTKDGIKKYKRFFEIKREKPINKS